MTESDPPMLTEEEVRLLSEARDHKLRSEALEFAYDDAISWIRRRRLFLQFLSILLAVGFLYVLYAMGDRGSQLSGFVSVGGRGASLLVMLMTIWGLVFKWDGQVEKKGQLSRQLRTLVGKYEAAMRKRPVDRELLHECDDARLDVDGERKHELGELRTRHLQKGHQHVAMLYSSLELKCTMCGRQWSPKLASRRKWVWAVPFWKCKGCGV